jgi:hypothetical protein
MKKINNTTSLKVKQHTTVYHIEYGKGTIVTIQYRKDGGLAMCFFPSAKVHDWITVTQLTSGTGEITLTPVDVQVQDNVSDTLQSALENLFNPTR